MKRKMFVALVLVVCLLFSSFTSYAATTGDVGDFVTRLYDVCLHRDPDEVGYNNWVSELTSKEKTGAQVAFGFVFSNEFRQMNLCDSCFVDSLYLCFFDRAADEGGKADWMSKLASGATKGSVFNGFIGSQEFTNLCNAYGIDRGEGDWSKEDIIFSGICGACGSANENQGVANSKVVEFIERLYQVCLDRSADAAGLEHWLTKAKNGESGAQIAYGFIFSAEFQSKNLCNEHFVDYMYKAFFGREADEAGKAGWVNKLNNGATKGQIFNGFIGSQEFANLCVTYNIEPGSGNYSSYDFKQNGPCTLVDVPSDVEWVMPLMYGDWFQIYEKFNQHYVEGLQPISVYSDGTCKYGDQLYYYRYDPEIVGLCNYYFNVYELGTWEETGMVLGLYCYSDGDIALVLDSFYTSSLNLYGEYYKPAHYEIIEVNTDNYLDYFEEGEYAQFYESDGLRCCDITKELRLKDEYVARLSLYNMVNCLGKVDYEFVQEYHNVRMDFDNQTYYYERLPEQYPDLMLYTHSLSFEYEYEFVEKPMYRFTTPVCYLDERECPSPEIDASHLLSVIELQEVNVTLYLIKN